MNNYQLTTKSEGTINLADKTDKKAEEIRKDDDNNAATTVDKMMMQL